MNKCLKVLPLIISTGFFISCTKKPKFEKRTRTPISESVNQINTQGAKFNNILTLPNFETQPKNMAKNVDTAIKTANEAFDRMTGLKGDDINFDNVVKAMREAYNPIEITQQRMSFMMNTSPDAKIRKAAQEQIQKLNKWSVKTQYREDIHKVFAALEKKAPALLGEDKRLFERTQRNYKRIGFNLSKKERKSIEEIQQKLNKLTVKFAANIREAKKKVLFSASDLEGVPADRLAELPKTQKGQYEINPGISSHVVIILTHAKNEEVRKKTLKSRHSVAIDKNLKLLPQIIKKRQAIAKKLGYTSWADYKTEIKMIGSGKRALNFLDKLTTGLEPKFKAETEELRKLKVRETKNPKAQIKTWDVSYYKNILNKEKYDLDTEKMRVYFPYKQTLNGMFDIYEHIFGIHIDQVKAPYTWHKDVELYVIKDKKTQEPLAFFYLDMFPREGKYKHFASFTLMATHELSNKKILRPVSSLVCNFTKPTADKPSLLTFDRVETLFHEFGHTLHTSLARAKYTTFAGTAVPRDFVESPSQTLEYWLESKPVLDTFAVHYKNPKDKISADFLEKMEKSKKASIALFYRRQLAFGKLDMALHTANDEQLKKIKDMTNTIIDETYFKPIDNTAFVAGFGHLMGYDAGYYGYAWADAISADLASKFKNKKNGFLDPTLGMQLRKSIYEPGDTRDVDQSIQEFLGRPWELRPFLENLGIKTKS